MSPPLYDYVCSTCNETFEIQHSIKDQARTICEQCGKSTLQRLISQTSFVLKGSGWFKDGYSKSE